MEEDVDYMAKEVSSVEGVESADECQLKCEEDLECHFWTWGKVRGWAGLSDVCFFKSASRGAAVQRFQKFGVVSGVPCSRRASVASKGARKKSAVHDDDADGKACTTMEFDTDYVSPDNIEERRGVKSAKACRELCEQTRDCASWSWGTEGGPRAMVQVCFLKPWDPSTWRYPLAGVVSGLPCVPARQLRHPR
jgi:hypothetical protein